MVDPRERGNKVSNENDTLNGTEITFEASNDNRNDNRNDNGNEIETKILDVIASNRNANLEIITEKTGLSRPTVYRHIKALVSVGKLIREGATKNGHWRVV
ncbi:MAG: winged helix-turn-helix transcriptional regulator [Spirochaetales bacterium]|nr:winged helix-turn-helix transcriptional regulator [Spirochaetales bacterium]